jgi:hypothetical protein
MSLPDMPGRKLLVARDRWHSEISKWKLLKFIRRNEALSTSEYKTYHKYTIFEPNKLKSLSCNKRNFLDPFPRFLFFSRSNFLPQFTHLLFYEEYNSCSQCLQLTQSIQSSSFIDHEFSHNSRYFFSEYSSVSCLWISVFIGLFYFWIFWLCRPEVLFFTFDFSVLCITSLLLSLFLEIVSFFSDKKENCYLSIEYFLGIFGTRRIFFKGLE